LFGDYLLAQGITSRADRTGDDWVFWVHDEDKVPRAREELALYLGQPDDPRYRAASGAAEEVRKRSEQLDREYRKNVRSLSGSWDGLRFRRRPLTVSLVAACVVVYLIGGLVPGANSWFWEHLGFFPNEVAGSIELSRGLEAITRRGEVWRLITPSFLHLGLLHLVFNVWATMVEGTLIETRRGSRTLLILVLVSAAASNVGQFLYVANFDQVLHGWGGFSGVGFALFGYLWMKGVNEPEDGMMLHPSTVRMMLLWLLLGFTGIFPMANGAHLMGLVVGVLFGMARF
jgi:GlpG protein